MSAINLIGKIRGYVTIQADGYFIERFLNICMRRGILLWNVKKVGETRICACMSIAGFLRVRQIASKTKTHVKIIKRSGFPFFLHRYRKRKAVFIGIILFSAITFYMSSHVMGIDVFGNNRIPTADILCALEEFGLHHGASLSTLDTRLIQNKMMTKLDDIAWIGINLKGARISVEIRERLDTKVELNKDEPCNIVASKSGILRLLEVKNGQTVVRVGSMVEKGELLVSGIVDSSKEGMRYVHSFGDIYADTIYKKTREYPLEYTEKLYTGNSKTRYGIEILGHQINPFFKERSPYENCDKEHEPKEYRAPLSFIPSLFINKYTYSEYIPQKNKRNIEQVVALGKSELGGEIEKEISESAEIKNINVTYLPLGNKIEVTVEYECFENIAAQSPIDKIDFLNYDIDSIEKGTED